MSEFKFWTDQTGATLDMYGLDRTGAPINFSTGYTAVADIVLLSEPSEILLSLTSGSITLGSGTSTPNVAVVFTVANWTTLTGALSSELSLTLPDAGSLFRCRVTVTRTSDSFEPYVYEPTFRLMPAPT